MKNKKQLAITLANIAHTSLMLLRDDEPLDGDKTEAFSKLFLQELDYLNGNKNEIEEEEEEEEEPNYCPKCGKIIPDNYYLCQSCESERQ